MLLLWHNLPCTRSEVYRGTHSNQGLCTCNRQHLRPLAPVVAGRLGTGLVFVVASVGRLRRNLLSTQIALVTIFTTTNALAVDPALVGKSSLHPILPVGADALQARSVMLAAVFAIMYDLVMGLANTWVAQTVVDILGHGTADRTLRGGLDRLFAMAAVHIGIHRLAAHFVLRPGVIGAFGGSSARREGFGSKLGDVIRRGIPTS